MKKLFAAAAIILAALQLSAAGPNQKFLREAAKAVWGKQLEQFNPKANLESAMFKDASAAVIAVYDDVNGKVSLSSLSPSTGLHDIYENTVVIYTRKMVKINDASAIENFSSLTFSPLRRISAPTGALIFEAEEAVGARIYKPDGSLHDVDMKNTLVETSGKKGKKEEKYKIAIPGLEVGDVIEYFHYRRIFCLGNMIPEVEFTVLDEYPTLSYELQADFASGFSVEVTSHNGLEVPRIAAKAPNGNNLYTVKLNDLPALDTQKWFSAGRQIPYLTMNIQDNQTKSTRKSRMLRTPGFYVFTTSPVVPRQIAESFSKMVELPDMVPGKVNSLVNDFKAAHPEASEREIADAAWLSTLYVTMTDDRHNYDRWDIVSLFKDVMDKQKPGTPVTLAATSPRSAPDIEHIDRIGMVSPIAVMGDAVYMVDESMAPGEIPGEYLNEKMYLFKGARRDLFDLQTSETKQLPKGAMRQNSDTRDVTVTIPADPSATEVNFDYTVTMTGALKSQVDHLLSLKDFVKGIEDYLGVPEKKRWKKKFDEEGDEAERSESLEKLPNADFDIEIYHVDNVAMLGYGNLPNDNEVKYQVTGTIDGLLSPAGNDIIFNIGRLGGKFSDFKTLKDNREIDIITNCPSQTRTNITVDIPEGYYVEESELQALDNTVTNQCGQFYTKASLTPEGKLLLQVQLRNPQIVYSMKNWPEFLAVRRAAAEFSDKSIILHRK